MANNRKRFLSPIRSLVDHRALILDLARREIDSRYKGSVAGLLWSFFNPLLMLGVYTFVFSVIFQSKWAGGSGSKTEFALVLFAGLIFFGIFSEVVGRAPTLILGNVNYVKKIIFPVEILSYVVTASALFQFLASMFVWLVFYFIFFGLPPLTIFLLPFVMLPALMLTLGCSWMLASLGVYLRDTPQVVAIGITILMFLSPVFYSTASVPANYHYLLQLNPLTFIIETARDVMIWGKPIVWTAWLKQFIIATLVFFAGFVWFQKTRDGFADVL